MKAERGERLSECHGRVLGSKHLPDRGVTFGFCAPAAAVFCFLLLSACASPQADLAVGMGSGSNENGPPNASAKCAAFPAAMASRRFEYSEVAMGVRARIVVYASDENKAVLGVRAAFARIAEIEDATSDYRPTSELMRLCARAGGPAVRISRDLMRVLIRSREISERSGGAFDVTVGPMVKLWRTARRSGRLPSSSELDAARRLVGWKKLHLDPGRSTARLETPGMLLDAGGIAKGYACDQALETLKSHGIASALVEMGGDIALSDPPPGKNGWQIEIPAANRGRKRQTLARVGISTSGNTEQFVEIGGNRYSHIVDPRTGLGVTHRLLVTVVAPECTISDALSTAISVLGERKGRALAGRYRGVIVYTSHE